MTALVYVPDGRRQPHPAVLVASGHSANGKTYYQALCQRLAARGYVVICWDPVGQGERSQFWDASAKRSRYNLICGEHAFSATSPTSPGPTSRAGKCGRMRRSTMLTRPEVVNPALISITGTSGCCLPGALIAASIRASTSRPIRLHQRAAHGMAIDLRGSRSAPRDLYRMIADGVDHPGLLLLSTPGPFSWRLRYAIFSRSRHASSFASRRHYRRRTSRPLASTRSTQARVLREKRRRFRFLDRFTTSRAPGPATVSSLDEPGHCLHATGSSDAGSSGCQDIDGRDSRLPPRACQDAGNTPSSRIFWPRLSGHLALASRAVRRLGLGAESDPVGGGRHGCLRWRLYRQVRAASQGGLSMPLLHLHPEGASRRRVLLWVGDRGKADVHDWSAMQRYIADGYDVVSFDGRGLGETRMRYTAMSIDDPSLAQQDFDRAYTSPPRCGSWPGSCVSSGAS